MRSQRQTRNKDQTQQGAASGGSDGGASAASPQMPSLLPSFAAASSTASSATATSAPPPATTAVLSSSSSAALPQGPVGLINTSRLVDPWTDDSCRDFLVSQTIVHLFYYHYYATLAMHQQQQQQQQNVSSPTPTSLPLPLPLPAMGSVDHFQRSLATVLDLKGLVARVQHLPSIGLTFAATLSASSTSDVVDSCVTKGGCGGCCDAAVSSSPPTANINNGDRTTSGLLTSCTVMNFFTAITGQFPSNASFDCHNIDNDDAQQPRAITARRQRTNVGCPHHNPLLRSQIPTLPSTGSVSRKSATPSNAAAAMGGGGGTPIPLTAHMPATPLSHQQRPPIVALGGTPIPAQAGGGEVAAAAAVSSRIAPRTLRFVDDDGEGEEAFTLKALGGGGDLVNPTTNDPISSGGGVTAESDAADPSFPSIETISFCCPGCLADVAAHFQSLLVRNVVMERWGVKDMQFICWLLGKGAAVAPNVAAQPSPSMAGGGGGANAATGSLMSAAAAAAAANNAATDSPSQQHSLFGSAATPLKGGAPTMPPPTSAAASDVLGTPMRAPAAGLTATPAPVAPSRGGAETPTAFPPPPLNRSTTASHHPTLGTVGGGALIAPPPPLFPFQVPPSRRELLTNILKSVYYDALRKGTAKGASKYSGNSGSGGGSANANASEAAAPAVGGGESTAKIASLLKQLCTPTTSTSTHSSAAAASEMMAALEVSPMEVLSVLINGGGDVDADVTTDDAAAASSSSIGKKKQQQGRGKGGADAAGNDENEKEAPLDSSGSSSVISSASLGGGKGGGGRGAGAKRSRAAAAAEETGAPAPTETVAVEAGGDAPTTAAAANKSSAAPGDGAMLPPDAKNSSVPAVSVSAATAEGEKGPANKATVIEKAASSSVTADAAAAPPAEKEKEAGRAVIRRRSGRGGEGDGVVVEGVITADALAAITSDTMLAAALAPPTLKGSVTNNAAGKDGKDGGAAGRPRGSGAKGSSGQQQQQEGEAATSSLSQQQQSATGGPLEYVKVPCLELDRVWMYDSRALGKSRQQWRAVQQVACGQLLSKIEAADLARMERLQQKQQQLVEKARGPTPIAVHSSAAAALKSLPSMPPPSSTAAATAKLSSSSAAPPSPAAAANTNSNTANALSSVVDIDDFGRQVLAAFREVVAEEEEEGSSESSSSSDSESSDGGEGVAKKKRRKERIDATASASSQTDEDESGDDGDSRFIFRGYGPRTGFLRFKCYRKRGLPTYKYDDDGEE